MNIDVDFALPLVVGAFLILVATADVDHPRDLVMRETGHELPNIGVQRDWRP